jgi:hypothetical protein
VTEAATASAGAAGSARAQRAPRRAPGELSYRLDEALVERRASAEPDWLAVDRRTALDAFRALPIESNQLYTPYVDLRAAALEDVRAIEVPLDAAVITGELDDGLAARAAFDEGRLTGLAVQPDAVAAGVTVEPIASLLRRDPAAARRLLADPASLPTEDRLAQLSRAN